MKERLAGMLSGVRADYADIRHEVLEQTRVVWKGGDLREVSASGTDGFVVRALCGSGFASVAATREQDVPMALERACEGARMMDGAGKSISMAPVPPAVDSVLPALDRDPAEVPVREKIDTTGHYNALMLGCRDIRTTTTAYHEIRRDKSFASTEGALLDERLVTVAIAAEAVARRGSLVQTTRKAVGGSDGWGRLAGRDQVFLDLARTASDLLEADPVRGGTYDVVLNPGMAGLFTHEAFGHFSEADIIEDNPTLRDRMRIGEKLGSPAVNIVADSSLPHQVGFYRYDDEGVPTRRVQLMKEGVLTGRLHSRATAAAFGEPPTGHSIAQDHRYEPIVRMGTIFIEPGSSSPDDLISALGDGLYIVDPYGGQTSGENFTFGAQCGWRVEGGRLAGMVRDINIMGNLFSTLASFEATASDFALTERGGCGKGQTNFRSAYGGPHVLIRRMVIGGV